MKQCPQCGSPANDGSSFCENCGYRFPQCTVCPQCGARLSGGETFCEQCGCNLATTGAAPHHAGQPAAAPMAQQTPTRQAGQPIPQQYPVKNQPSSTLNTRQTVLYVLLGLLLGSLCVAGWAVYSGKIDLGKSTFAKSKAAGTDNETTTEVPVGNHSDQDSTTESTPEDEPVKVIEETLDSVEATPKQPEVYMSLWGSIGDSEEVDFEMRGTSGWYIYKRNGTTGPKRTLKLKSFNTKTRRCLIDAYLNGKYIGCFEGKFIDDVIDLDDGEQKVVQVYDGVFKSVNGAKIDFYLYYD